MGLKVNRLVLYMSRPLVEQELMRRSAEGFIFAGDHRSGKTILLQNLVRSLADDFLRKPQSGKVPVLASFHDLTNSQDTSMVLCSAMQQHFPVRDRIFRWLLRKNRLVCIFDGLDELVFSEVAVRSLQDFHGKHPSIPLIVATPPLQDDPLAMLNLPVYHLPPFTDAEREKLKKIEERMK